MTVALVLLFALLPWLWLADLGPPYRVWAWVKALRAVTLGVSGYLLTVEPALGLVGLSIGLRWRPITATDSLTGRGDGWLLAWAAAVAVWFLARALPPELRVPIWLAWLVCAGVNAGLILAHWVHAKHWAFRDFPTFWPRETPSRYGGTFGQRTFAGGYLALVTPLAFLLPAPWSWAVAAVLVAAQVTACSFLSLGCLFLAAMVLWPPAAPWIGLGLAGAVALVWGAWRGKVRRGRESWLDRWTTRKGSLDSVAVRWRHWTGAWAIWAQWPVWVTGRGLGAGWADQLRMQVGRSHRTPQLGHLHNDWAEFAYEHGVLGVAALVCFLWRLAPGLSGGSPWTATVIVGSVLALGTFSARLLPLVAPWWIVCAWTAP